MSEGLELTIGPRDPAGADLLAARPAGRWRGWEQEKWRQKTRQELGLPTNRPVVATGHQTLLWHPGILAKYLVVAAFAAEAEGPATANLVVDQHTGVFGEFDVPVRGADGALSARTLTLTRPRRDVPMGRHPPFEPLPPPAELPAALPSVRSGVERIFAAVAAHRNEDNAALQMAAALSDLMSPWVGPAFPQVTASRLIETTLGRALVEEMAGDPRRCAACYNAAIDAVPEGGIAPLSVTGEVVELPLWRLGPDGRRHRAHQGDLSQPQPRQGFLPRALFLTALVRLGMCDLYVHGTGGARYDHAMELWLADWLGLEPSPIVVATATLRLPLRGAGEPPEPLESAVAAARRAWHDPTLTRQEAGPSAAKRRLFEAIEAAPRGSKRRSDLFRQLHGRLETQRLEHAGAIEAARARVRAAARAAAAAPIADRRTWPFPLYPREQIDELAASVAARVRAVRRRPPPPSRLGPR